MRWMSDAFVWFVCSVVSAVRTARGRFVPLLIAAMEHDNDAVPAAIAR